MSLFRSVCLVLLVSFCFYYYFFLWMRKIFEQKIRMKPVKTLIVIMIIIKEYLDL